MNLVINALIPNWPAPPQIKAYSTYRTPGHSLPPFTAFNLGLHVGDDPIAVDKNRQQLITDLNLPTKPVWLTQTHSTTVVDATNPSTLNADASFSRQEDIVCVVMTADCLPILLCNRQGTEIAAIHAGWRGLCDGIIKKSLAQLSSASDDLMAWMGPCIGQSAYEVDEDVYLAFKQAHNEDTQGFVRHAHKYHLSLTDIAARQLTRLGVTALYKANLCTRVNDKQFFSYRRDQQTGRMATLLWISK